MYTLGLLHISIITSWIIFIFGISLFDKALSYLRDFEVFRKRKIFVFILAWREYGFFVCFKKIYIIEKYIERIRK